MSLPEAILHLRKRHLNASGPLMGKLLGVKRQAIDQWEKGATTPTRGNLMMLLRLAKESRASDEILTVIEAAATSDEART